MGKQWTVPWTDGTVQRFISNSFCFWTLFYEKSTYYTFDNKGCHRSSNFLTTKVFTVYLDKNTIYSVENSERKKVRSCIPEWKKSTSLTGRLLSDRQDAYSTKNHSYLNWPSQFFSIKQAFSISFSKSTIFFY